MSAEEPTRLPPSTAVPNYRSVIMKPAVQLPDHNLHESPNSRGITINNWTITATTKPISSAAELDALQSTLGGLPLPEMTFGSNTLELVHGPSGWKYVFGTEGALRGVKNGELGEGDGGVKVGYADEWLKSRCGRMLGLRSGAEWRQDRTRFFDSFA